MAEAPAETTLLRVARPVLNGLANSLGNEPVSLILTDPDGVILARFAGDSRIMRHLDAAHLLPGFSYSEGSVGTNGIGTAVETRTAQFVHGPEHYASSLAVFSCAGVPIIHPISGVVLGVLDLTSLSDHATPLLLSFAKASAVQIEQALLADSSKAELALLRDYRSAVHHTGGAVLAQSDNLVLLSDQARRSYDAADQAALLAQSADLLGATDRHTVSTMLPSGISVTMDYRPTFSDDALAGGTLRIRQDPTPAASAASAETSAITRAEVSLGRGTLPGLVGTHPLLRAAVRAVAECRATPTWTVIEGEPGVGKMTVARAVQKDAHLGGSVTIREADELEDPEVVAEVVAAMDGDPQDLVLIRDAHALSDASASELSTALATVADAERTQRPWLVVTVVPGSDMAPAVGEFLAHLPRTVTIPPLRHRADDIALLAPHLLRRVVRDDAVTLSNAALGQLKRLSWPGNVDQLRKVLTEAARKRRTGAIVVGDLPGEARATSRRALTPLEAMQRDAIITALDAHAGDKPAAAETLGISRATIYRKIRDYGIHT
ncbi:sigma-54-dependent Fis family transcriptional regulator [Knoellia sinensis]|uniref:sigma-54-dependent Fis family transcriptional regulator n=1 Tax=Knoellia sinensis TaxID=136100 RepID=UPI00056AA70A|nr:GAF domain-containing protein [Knoellia sinensis]